ncbi:hypothetical protein LN893_08135 [Pontibacter sp. XAAS-A31]|nr:hypothetical protein [Pontibacter harenae]
MEPFTINILNILLLATIALYLALLGFILTWVYFDAEQRGVNGFMIVALTFFSGTIFGTLAWLVLRPRLQPQPIPVRS